MNLSALNDFQLQSRVQKSEEGEVVFLSNSEMIGSHLSANKDLTPNKKKALLPFQMLSAEKDSISRVAPSRAVEVEDHQ